MSRFLFWWFWLPLSLFLIGLISYVVAKLMHKKKIANISLCFMSWMTLSFLFPSMAKKNGVIKSWWLAILLMLVSPAAIATYYVVATLGFGISTYRHKELKFTDEQSIVSLTGLRSIPEYEYLNNSYDYWDGIHYVRYKFKEEPNTSFFQEIEELRKQKDNLFWSLDTLSFDTDKHFYGSDSVYIFSRGWDGVFIKAPISDVPENVDVKIVFGKKGFICKYSEYNNRSFDRLGNRDSISNLTGVQFPSYKNVDCHFNPCGPDWSEDWVILFDELPSKEFIRHIKASPNWEQLKDGSYKFEKEHPGQLFETIYIREGSKIVNASCWTM